MLGELADRLNERLVEEGQPRQVGKYRALFFNSPSPISVPKRKSPISKSQLLFQ